MIKRKRKYKLRKKNRLKKNTEVELFLETDLSFYIL